MFIIPTSMTTVIFIVLLCSDRKGCMPSVRLILADEAHLNNSIYGLMKDLFFIHRKAAFLNKKPSRRHLSDEKARTTTRKKDKTTASIIS